MAEILVGRGLRIFVDIFCFFSAGVALINKTLTVHIYEILQFSPTQNDIVLMLSSVFLAVRIVWFVYEKFWLAKREKEERKRLEKEYFENLFEKHFPKKETKK